MGGTRGLKLTVEQRIEKDKAELKKVDDSLAKSKDRRKKKLQEIKSRNMKNQRTEERREDALIGVAMRWVSHSSPESYEKVMKILEKFYFDDSSREFFGFELLPGPKKGKLETARKDERNERKKAGNGETATFRIKKTEPSAASDTAQATVVEQALSSTDSQEGDPPQTSEPEDKENSQANSE